MPTATIASIFVGHASTPYKLELIDTEPKGEGENQEYHLAKPNRFVLELIDHDDLLNRWGSASTLTEGLQLLAKALKESGV